MFIAVLSVVISCFCDARGPNRKQRCLRVACIERRYNARRSYYCGEPIGLGVLVVFPSRRCQKQEAGGRISRSNHFKLLQFRFFLKLARLHHQYLCHKH